MHGPTCVFWANLTPFSLKAELGPALAAAFQRAFDLRALLGAERPADCTPRPLPV